MNLHWTGTCNPKSINRIAICSKKVIEAKREQKGVRGGETRTKKRKQMVLI